MLDDLLDFELGERFQQNFIFADKRRIVFDRKAALDVHLKDVLDLALGILFGERFGSMIVEGGRQELLKGDDFVLVQPWVVADATVDLSFFARYFL